MSCTTVDTSTQNNWLFDVQKDLDSEPESIILRCMFEAIQKHIHENDYKWIAWRLDILNPEIMHPVAIVAVARYSSEICDDSIVGPHWKAFLERSRVALLKRGLDAELILRGLK